MSDISPPEQPGMYADAHGSWWWWDGSTWTAAPDWGPLASARGGRHEPERNQAVLMWILFIVLGGWIVALVFYLVSRDKPFVRHHAAEALNLTIVLLIPQLAGAVLMFADLIFVTGLDDPYATPSALFWVGMGLLLGAGLLTYALGIPAAVKAHRGEWWRLPIGLHPVRGVIGRGAAPPYDVGT
jgi:uncharacterized Tic20 family protein